MLRDVRIFGCSYCILDIMNMYIFVSMQTFYDIIILSCDVGYFHWLKIIYMAVLMAEDKSRYNDMNIILHETDTNLSGYHSNSLIVHCFIHYWYHLEPNWTLADQSLHQLLLKLKVLRCFRNLQNVS